MSHASTISSVLLSGLPLDAEVLNVFVILEGAGESLALLELYPLQLPHFQPRQDEHRDLVCVLLYLHLVHSHASATSSVSPSGLSLDAEVMTLFVILA